MIRWLTYNTTKLLFWLFCPFTLTGKENVPKEGGFLFCSNHASNIDPMLMGIISARKVSFFAKAELFDRPILGWWLKGCNAFPVKRGQADIGALKHAVKRLCEGTPLVFFPQGTRVDDQKNAKVFPGAGFLVAKSGVPAVPVYIDGSDQALPPKARWLRRRPLRIVIGPPVGFSPDQSYEEISQEIMDCIYNLPNKN